MTDTSKVSAGRSVLVTTRNSPLSTKIEALMAHVLNTYSVECDAIYLEDVFASTAEQQDQSRFNDLVQTLIHSQLAFIDLTVTANAFYLTGVRHAVSNGITVLLAPDSETSTVANARFTTSKQSYIDMSADEWLQQVTAELKDLNRPHMAQYQNDLRASRAFKVMPLEQPFKVSKRHETVWQLNHPGNTVEKTGGPKIVIWEYQIQKAVDFDVWVNSENTFMEMARFWDRSVSAQIRKRGAVLRGSLENEAYKDALGLALAEKVGTRSRVPVGTVFMTPTDRASTLSKVNRVDYVAHLAAVTPTKVGVGFTSGGKVKECVQSVFEAMTIERRRRQNRRGALRSVLFPMIGSGDGGAHPAFVGHQMVLALQELIALNLAAPETLSRKQREAVKRQNLQAVSTIGLIAYQPSHLEFLRRELNNSDFIAIEPAGV